MYPRVTTTAQPIETIPEGSGACVGDWYHGVVWLIDELGSVTAHDEDAGSPPECTPMYPLGKIHAETRTPPRVQHGYLLPPLPGQRNSSSCAAQVMLPGFPFRSVHR